MDRQKKVNVAVRGAGMSLWFWPTIAAVVAFILGTALSSFALSSSLPIRVFEAGPGAARTVLTALVGGLVTALSVIFSLAITGLQVVHQQYSPRLLRNFLRDRATKVMLGVFASSVAYKLAVIRSLPASDSTDPVPQIAVALAMVLFMGCVGAVAYFAQHITDSIRVHRAMQRVVSDCDDTIALAASKVRVRSNAERSVDFTEDETNGDWKMVPAPSTGYVQEIDLDGLAFCAEKYGRLVRVVPIVGDQIMSGTPLIFTKTDTDTSQNSVSATRVEDLTFLIQIGKDRSINTDIAYGIRQLVDVAIRAMSPSINDPYTAMQAIDHLGALICRLAQSEIEHGCRYGRNGKLIVLCKSLTLDDFVRLACQQPLRYGGHEPAVALRLVKILRDIAYLAPKETGPALHEEAQRVLNFVEKNAEPTDDLTPIRTEFDTLEQWLNGKPSQPNVTFMRL